MGGRSRGCRHDVVGHLAILHPPILPNHFFIQGESDALRDATDDLSSCQNRVQHSSYFLKRHEVVHRHVVCCQVDRDLRNVNGPGERGVSFAAIFSLIPENAVRRFVARQAAKFAVLRNIMRGRPRETLLAE